MTEYDRRGPSADIVEIVMAHEEQGIFHIRSRVPGVIPPYPPAISENLTLTLLDDCHL